MTNSDYYDRYIYPVDYLETARWVGYNVLLSFASMFSTNQFEVYENSIIVEYCYEKPSDIRIKEWNALRIVFKEYQGEWFLCGLINAEWIY